ncbi:hypothetical protein PHPALM_29907, partial [Phytophthora palmivora]
KFLKQDPVMRILGVKQIGDLRNPISAPINAVNKLEAVKDLLRLLKEAGMIVGAFDADDLFDLNMKVIQSATQDLYSKLKILVGEIPRIADHVPLSSASIADHQTASSNYASAAEGGSDISSEPKRISLGLSRTSMMEVRSKIQRQGPARFSRPEKIMSSVDQITAATMSEDPSGTLQKYFEAALSRFLA